MQRGTISKIVGQKGFGFIKPNMPKTGEGEVFFHVSAVVGPVGFDAMTDGKLVEFDIGRAPDGRTRATVVRVID